MSSDSLAIIENPATQLIEVPVEKSEFAGFSIIRRHLPLVLICTALGVLAAYLITQLQTPLYTASSSVQIEQQATKIIGEDENASTQADAERQLNTQLELLRSRALAARVATDLGLVGNDGFYAAMGAEASQSPSQAVGDPRAERERTAGLLADNVSVALPKDSRVAKISFTSASPQVSAAVANAYAYGLVKLNLERRYRSSDYARNYLNNQIVEARLRLEGSERALNEYARGAGLINTGSSEGRSDAAASSVTQSTLLQLNEALGVARAQRIAAEQRLRAANSSPLMSLPEVVNNDAVQRMLSERAAQQVTLSETRERYTAEHPTAVMAAARVRQLDEQIQSIASSVGKSLEMQYRAARGQEAALAGQVTALKGQTLAEQDRSVRYNILRHEVDTNRSMYDLLLQRQREVSTSAGVAANNISVLDEAGLPAVPSSPKPLLNMLAGLFLGLISGLVLAVLRELTDDRVSSTEEIEQKLGLTSLGEIPMVRYLEDHSLIKSLDDPDTEIGMRYTAFRTSLLFSTKRGLPKTLVITSSGEGEGKSTTALATARSLASSGKQVLLIEGDLRRKSISDLLGLNDEIGLSALLTGQAEFGDAIQKTDLPKLDAISGGTLPPNPADILDPERLRVILDWAALSYDCTIIDAPPVADLADAPLIAAAAQNVIFVVAARSNHRGRAKAALRRLKATGATILGVVLTKAPSRGSTLYAYRGLSLKKLHSRPQPRLEAAA